MIDWGYYLRSTIHNPPELQGVNVIADPLFLGYKIYIMSIENGDLVKHKRDDLVIFVDDASNTKLIKCRKSYEDDRPDEIFYRTW